jgi:hypothetical protein
VRCIVATTAGQFRSDTAMKAVTFDSDRSGSFDATSFRTATRFGSDSDASARAFAPAELNPHRLHRRALAALRAQHVPELMALLK